MDFFINAGAKLQGMTTTIMDLLPLLGALGGILGVASSVLVRAAAANDPAGVFHAVHPTAEELGVLSVSSAVIKSHFAHVSNAAKLDDHAEALAKVVPQANP